MTLKLDPTARGGLGSSDKAGATKRHQFFVDKQTEGYTDVIIVRNIDDVLLEHAPIQHYIDSWKEIAEETEGE